MLCEHGIILTVQIAISGEKGIKTTKKAIYGGI